MVFVCGLWACSWRTSVAICQIIHVCHNQLEAGLFKNARPQSRAGYIRQPVIWLHRKFFLLRVTCGYNAQIYGHRARIMSLTNKNTMFQTSSVFRFVWPFCCWRLRPIVCGRVKLCCLPAFLMCKLLFIYFNDGLILTTVLTFVSFCYYKMLLLAITMYKVRTRIFSLNACEFGWKRWKFLKNATSVS